MQELQQMGFSREITQEHAEKITCKRLWTLFCRTVGYIVTTPSSTPRLSLRLTGPSLNSLPCRLDGTYVYTAALVFTVLKITSTAMPTSSTDYAINGNSHSGPRDRNLCRHSFTYTRRSNPHKLITTVDLLNKVNTYLHVTSFYHDRNSQYKL